VKGGTSEVDEFSNQQQVICKGMELACCETIHFVHASRVNTARRILTGCTQNAKILVQLPLSFGGTVEKLLNEFSYIFSAGPHDFGCTAHIEHQINTGKAPPIQQLVRRLPLAKERKLKELFRR